ncbi:MAG: type IIL restriction-modification enzyme MmeI [Pseudonocardia sp.]
MPSGLEIQQQLRAFVKRWQDYRGSERGGAQTFLNQLFACYGTDRFEAGALFEDSHVSVGIMDLYWPGVCIIEMKAPSRRPSSPSIASRRSQAGAGLLARLLRRREGH